MPSSLAVLRDFMLQRYDDLKARLTRRLGCADMASDALQDTWLRLEGKDELGPVDSPGAYLLRMAVNVAVDQQRAENRRLTSSEAEALLALPTPRPVRRRRRKAARNWTRWCGSWASCPSVSAGCCWPCGWKDCRRPRWRRAWVCRCAPWSANCAARMSTVRRASVIYCHHKNASPRRIPAARTVIGVARAARRRSMPASPYRRIVMKSASRDARRRQADIERQARAWIRLLASGRPRCMTPRP